MKPLFPFLTLSLAATGVWAHGGHPATDAAPGSQAAVCERMVDVAIQTVAERDKGLPMKVYEADGSQVPAIANQIIATVYAEPAISSPKRAAAFGRVRCNELWRD